MIGPESALVPLGRISGAHGVQGWVKVHSDTVPRENILMYSPWQLCVDDEWVTATVTEGKRQGKGVVAKLDICQTRSEALALQHCDVAVDRAQLPRSARGEYYWVDLIGLEVVTQDGLTLGHVQRLIETGSNDVLVLKGDKERLIPFIEDQVVLAVDFNIRQICVDWDPSI